MAKYKHNFAVRLTDAAHKALQSLSKLFSEKSGETVSLNEAVNRAVVRENDRQLKMKEKREGKSNE